MNYLAFKLMKYVLIYIKLSKCPILYLFFRKKYVIRLCIHLYRFKTYVNVTTATNRYLVTWTIGYRWEFQPNTADQEQSLSSLLDRTVTRFYRCTS